MATTATQPTATTHLEADELVQVFRTLRAYTGRIEGYQITANPHTTARLRMRLAEYDATPAMRDTVLLVRRYFNTYTANDWRLVEWQVAAALKLLATVADEVDPLPQV